MSNYIEDDGAGYTVAEIEAAARAIQQAQPTSMLTDSVAYSMARAALGTQPRRDPLEALARTLQATLVERLRVFADGLTAKARGPGLTGEQAAEELREWAGALEGGSAKGAVPCLSGNKITPPECIHIARGELHAVNMLYLETLAEASPDFTYRVHDRTRVCALCSGYLAGLLHNGLRGSDAAAEAMADAAYHLWAVLANVSGGEWREQSPAWQEAARHARYTWHVALEKHNQAQPRSVSCPACGRSSKRLDPSS